ncbi:hypothetical protein P8631_08775 [Guyparkeria sp. 1SP6A2]|nr:hypothetical protein [Guyparkeria sp. 1SP6A2]
MPHTIPTPPGRPPNGFGAACPPSGTGNRGRFSRPTVWLRLAALTAGVIPALHAAPVPPSELELPSAVDEASGLAQSLRHPGWLWTHNDNINDPGSPQRVTPYLYAISTQGDRRVSLELQGVTQRDWESVDAARIDGRDTLIVADSGDNRDSWRDYVLWFVPEPGSLDSRKTLRVGPDTLLRYRYPDGSADTEAMVFDHHSDQILLLTKREDPPRLYGLPLDARVRVDMSAERSNRERLEAAPVTQASLIGTMSRLPPTDPINWLLSPLTGSQTNRPTGMALSSDGTLLAVLTYSSLYFFHRPTGASWDAAIKRIAASRSLPRIDQWEGIAFSADDQQLYVVREGGGPGNLIRLDVPASLQPDSP